MGLIKWLFQKKSETGIEVDRDIFREIKQIKEEAIKLEKEWIEKVEEFELRSYELHYGILPPPKSIGVYNPHPERLWKRFVRFDKKIRALELLFSLYKSYQNRPKTWKDIRAIAHLKILIRRREKNILQKFDKEIVRFEKAILKGEMAEDNLVTNWVFGEGDVDLDLKPIDWGQLTETEKRAKIELLKQWKKEDPIMWSNSTYDYHKRHDYFNHLRHLANGLRIRLKKLEKFSKK